MLWAKDDCESHSEYTEINARSSLVLSCPNRSLVFRMIFRTVLSSTRAIVKAGSSIVKTPCPVQLVCCGHLLSPRLEADHDNKDEDEDEDEWKGTRIPSFRLLLLRTSFFHRHLVPRTTTPGLAVPHCNTCIACIAHLAWTDDYRSQQVSIHPVQGKGDGRTYAHN